MEVEQPRGGFEHLPTLSWERHFWSWEGTALDGTRGVASSCEPSVPISSSELGTGWGAVSRLREVALGLRGHVGRGPPALPLEKEPCFEKCNRSG